MPFAGSSFLNVRKPILFTEYVGFVWQNEQFENTTVDLKLFYILQTNQPVK